MAESGRLPDPQSPLFARLNSSLAFDRRLWPQDIEGSRAHVGALLRAGVIDEGESAELLGGLDAVEAELAAGEFGFRDDDEDIHMAIERRLTEIAGAVGGKLHTGRSRNDQVATDLVLYVRDRLLEADRLLTRLMSRLADSAEAHLNWALPGYTHLQRAQPVYLSHHLLAYFWMLDRDRRRFAAALAGLEVPLGSGALAGVNYPLDRERTARELGGGDGLPAARNSLDAVSSRDFVLDYLAAASICATHLSRLGAEIVLWSSQEFGFCEPADDFSSGSSIMPQKKNPDAAELLRAKAPRVAARFAGFSGVMHALPLAYSKDLQEDKEALFDAVDTLELCLAAAAEMLGGMRFDRERMAAAAADDFPAATDVADLLVRGGMPFREAHGVVGALVREALERGIGLSELTAEDLARHSDLLAEGYHELFAPGATLESKQTAGGTSLQRVREQLDQARAALERT